MAEGKNYLGKGWINEKYELINLSLDKAKINELPVDDYGQIKVTVARMKKVDERTKATHTVYENTYQKQKDNSEF